MAVLRENIWNIATGVTIGALGAGGGWGLAKINQMPPGDETTRVKERYAACADQLGTVAIGPVPFLCEGMDVHHTEKTILIYKDGKFAPKHLLPTPQEFRSASAEELAGPTNETKEWAGQGIIVALELWVAGLALFYMSAAKKEAESKQKR